MPIEINYGAGAHVGPGFIVTIRTDLPGPWPADTHWNIQLVASPEDGTGHEIWNVPTPNPNIGLAGTLGFYDGQSHIVVGDDRIFHGATNALKVRLIADGVTADEVTIPVTTDLVTGTQALVVAEVGAGSGTGGLTPAQDLALTQVQMGIGWQIGGGITDAVFDLLDVVGRRLFGSELITPDREGEGTLTRPGPLGDVNAFGLAWQAVFWPEGVGVDEGNPDLLELEYMQLAQLSERGAAGQVVRDSRYVREINGEMLWMLDTPSAIGFYIQPGIRVRFWWLVLFGGAAQRASSSSTSLE